MATRNKNCINRRNFLKSAAVGAAAISAVPGSAASAASTTPKIPAAIPISPEAELPSSPAEILTTDRTGSDFMVDVIKSLGIEYVCANPGSSFRGLHESIINYGGNRSPEFITCCHEESSVGHGARLRQDRRQTAAGHGARHGRAAARSHGRLQRLLRSRPDHDHWRQYHRRHAAAYPRWNGRTAFRTRPRSCAITSNGMICPISLTHFAESTVRAYKMAMTPPMMPVLLIVDGELQENPIRADASLKVPRLTPTAPPVGDSGAIEEAAQLLVSAQNPVLIAGRSARTPAGITYLVELAETLQVPVIDQMDRMNFPTRHPLNQTERSRELISSADVIVGLEVNDFWGAVHSFRDQMERTSRPIARSDAKTISINSANLFVKSNYQNFQRYAEVDIDIPADTEATLPALTEAVKRNLDASRKSVLSERRAKLAAAHDETLQHTRDAAAYAWDASPVSTARLSAELWNQIKDEDWSLVSTVGFLSRWPLRLWDFEKSYHYIGGAGGYGIGYNAPASVGAALANRKYGRLTLNIQCDGDLMYAPGVLWTAAHHRIPLLTVMHNNRGYHQEVMQVQIMADRHSRGIDRAKIGTTLTDPHIDFAKLAQSMGVYSEGPIADPKELAPAITRAVQVVKRGEPALLDVVTQPR